MSTKPSLDPEYFNRLVKMMWDYIGEVAKLYLGEEMPPLLAERLGRKRDVEQRWFASPKEEKQAILGQVGQEGLLGAEGLFGEPASGLTRGNGNA